MIPPRRFHPKGEAKNTAGTTTSTPEMVAAAINMQLIINSRTQARRTPSFLFLVYDRVTKGCKMKATTEKKKSFFFLRVTDRNTKMDALKSLKRNIDLL